MTKRILLTIAAGAALLLAGCKVGASCALPFAAIGDTLVTPLNGCKWTSDKLIELGDEHQMKVYEETRNTAYGDLAAYTAYVYYLPGYVFWPFGAIAPSQLYPMTKSCLKVINGDNTAEAAAAESNAKYDTYKRRTGRDDSVPDVEEDSFEEW